MNIIERFVLQPLARAVLAMGRNGKSYSFGEYEVGTFPLAGAITGTVEFVRCGRMVTLVASSFSHSSATSASTGAGCIPERLRPFSFVNNLHILTGSPAVIGRVEVAADGTLASIYYDSNFNLQATTGVGLNITYISKAT